MAKYLRLKDGHTIRVGNRIISNQTYGVTDWELWEFYLKNPKSHRPLFDRWTELEKVDTHVINQNKEMVEILPEKQTKNHLTINGSIMNIEKKELRNKTISLRLKKSTLTKLNALKRKHRCSASDVFENLMNQVEL